MAKRSSSYRKPSSSYVEEPEQDEEIAEEVVEETTKEVYTKLRCLIAARVKAVGPVSGKQYEWSGAGTVVGVLDEDVPEMLKKRLGGKSCCGASSDGNWMFEIFKE